MKNKLSLTSANKVFFAFSAVLLAYQFIAILTWEALYDNIYLIIFINEMLIAAFVLVYCIVKNRPEGDIQDQKLELAPALLITLLSVPLFMAATMLTMSSHISCSS